MNSGESTGTDNIEIAEIFNCLFVYMNIRKFDGFIRHLKYKESNISLE